MNKNIKKFIIPTISALISTLAVVGILLFFKDLETYIKVICITCTALLSIASFVFAARKNQGLTKSCFVLNATLGVVLLCFLALNLSGVFKSFSDLEKVRQIILSSGKWGIAVYIAIQIFQVVILPLPAFIFYLAGTAIYGPLVASIISVIGALIGSIIAFFMGRLFGKKVVYWCVGKEQADKYARLIGDKGKLLFAIMEILPFFPDDILCMVAGLSSMSFAFFMAVMLIARPIYIFAVCFLGTGDVIPFSGWGIPVWIAIAAIIAIAFVVYTKHQARKATQ